MIFVVLGIEKFPFERMIKKIDSLVETKEIKDSIFIQRGSCKYEPKHCQWEDFLSFEMMCRNIEKANLIIAHAGAGTTLLCLQYGKKPILVPRQKRFKEHVDDHQVVFAQKMLQSRRVDVAFEMDQIIEHIHAHTMEERTYVPKKPESLKLVKYLNDLFRSFVV